jgi:hypothetical protein
MLNARFFSALVGSAFFIVAANAQVIFSNVNIAGSLSTGATFTTGPTFIEFFFPQARVGDGEPTRSGNLSMIYTALTSRPMISDDLVIVALGATSGSGQIFVNELVEDMSDPNNPVVISSHSAVVNNRNPLPYTAHLLFDRPSANIRVKKEFTLTANPDTEAFDFAAVGLVQQSISMVPEPATLIGLGAGIAAVLGLRRRKV